MDLQLGVKCVFPGQDGLSFRMAEVEAVRDRGSLMTIKMSQCHPFADREPVYREE